VGLHPAERVREYRDKGYWTDDMIDALLRERVSQFGDITAIIDPLNRESLLDGPFRTLTWPQLDEQVSRLAQVLLAEAVGTGDVVGVQLPNTVEIVVAFLAIVRIGAIVAPFPVQYRAWELTHLSNVAQVRAFLTASRIGQRPAAAELAGLRPQIPSLRWVGVFGAGLDERIADADDRSGLAAHLAGFSPDPNDCVTICWTDEDGYLRTGDILEIAGDNLEYLRYVDRSKDMVVRGGMKISAAELEGFIAGHPKVADVAVVAYPDEVLGERACAIVVPRPGQSVTLEEIVAYLRDLGIATFKRPERLEIRDELPRNPLGKILKRELRDELRQ